MHRSQTLLCLRVTSRPFAKRGSKLHLPPRRKPHDKWLRPSPRQTGRRFGSFRLENHSPHFGRCTTRGCQSGQRGMERRQPNGWRALEARLEGWTCNRPGSRKGMADAIFGFKMKSSGQLNSCREQSYISNRADGDCRGSQRGSISRRTTIRRSLSRLSYLLRKTYCLLNSVLNARNRYWTIRNSYKMRSIASAFDSSFSHW